jgi:lipopolysaccharide transport system ATP-binding protein
MDDVSREGRTILFVSHNLEAIQRLCSRGLLLEQGRLAASGPIGDIVSRYRATHGADENLGRFRAPSRHGLGYARVEDVRLVHAGRPTGRCAADEDLEFEIDVALADPARGSLRGLTVELTLCGDEGEPLCSLMNVDDGGMELPDAPACTLRAVLAAPTFVPGRYRLNTFVGIPNLQQADEVHDAFEFDILPPNEPWRPYEITSAHGPVCRRAVWTLRESGGRAQGEGVTAVSGIRPVA